MPGLVIKLSPHERIYVNGALIENGERKTTLCLPQADTDLLRARDILDPGRGADTLRAACILAQSALMTREARATLARQLEGQLAALLRDPRLRGNARVLAAARRLNEGSISGAHYQLLHAHHERHADACRSPEAGDAGGACRGHQIRNTA